jgi:hypothetical protein
VVKRKATRVTPKTLAQDVKIAQAVLQLEGYQSANPDFTPDRLREALKTMNEAMAAEEQALLAAATARERSINAESEFHECVLGAKRQAIALFGDDSDEITKLGLKKKSERKYGRPKKKPPTTPQ